MKVLAILLLLIASGSLIPSPCRAAPASWKSAGARGGYSADGLQQYEAFATYNLPVSFRNQQGWGAGVLLDLSAGTLEKQREYSFIGAFGPSFALGRTGLPVEIVLGVNAAILNRDKLGNRDYNGVVQFLSHVGVHCQVTGRIGLMYRFQHMSNAGLNGHRNPGVNLNIFGLSYEFDDGAALLR